MRPGPRHGKLPAIVFRKAVARLAAAPLFTAFAVLSVAAGVALTTAVYSVVDALMFARVEARDPQSLVVVMAPRFAGLRRAVLSVEDLDALRTSQQSLERVSGAVALFAQVESTRGAEPTLLEGVDGDYFPVVGVSARVGRLVDASDERSAARVAVISDAFWRSRFAADPAVTSRSLTINGLTFDIVGVVAERFAGLDSRVFGTQLWVPRSAVPDVPTGALTANSTEEAPLVVIGRIRSADDLAAASIEIETIARRLDASRPLRTAAIGAPPRLRQWSLRSALDQPDEDDGLRRLGTILVVLVSLVLVVACTNLANLVLARGTARQGELAVRLAMGASRARLVWEQCIESLLLSAMGAVAAYAMFVVVSAWMTQDFTMAAPPPMMGRLTLSVRPEINRDALLVSVGALLLSLAVFGLEPAVHLARTLDIRTALAAGATGVRPRVGRQRLILRWQVAVAAGFFIIATMFIRATIEQARHDSGIDQDRLAIATMAFQPASLDVARAQRAVERIVSDASQDPSVEAVTASTGLPFGVPALPANVATPGSQGNTARASAIAATPSIFRVLGVPIVHGRSFTDVDGVAAAPVAVISQLTAKQLFATGDPLGRSIVVTIGGRPTTATIIGISRDTDVGRLNGPRHQLIYVPLAQHFDRNITITARASGRVDTTVAALRRVVPAADPAARIDVAGSARSVLWGPFAIAAAAGRGALYLGAFTLLLSMVGLFGVQSQVVVFRTREFGVRMSLGASTRQIQAMVIRDGARPVFDGLVLGLWGGIAARILVRSYLDIDVTVLDSWMLIVAPVPIVLAALSACYLPATRASRVDPMTALRCE